MDERTREHPVVARLQRDVSLRRGAAEGAGWIGGARIGSQVFQFLAMLVTARLLVPSEFGAAAVALAVAAFGQLFTDLGLGAAVIHARRVTERLLSTAFALNVASGAALTGLVAALALPLAQLFGEPQLAGLLMVASLNFTLSCGVVQTALLERTFNFRRLAGSEVVASVAGAASGPAFALAGLGATSLVLAFLVRTALLSVLLWVSVRWVPRERPARAEVADLWRFSRGIVGFNAVNYWARNLDTLALGKFAPAAAVGEYTRAFSLTTVPLQQMSMVLGRVLYPALARLRDDPHRMGRAWVRGVGLAATVTLPATVTIAVTAPALVPVLFGPGWDGMVPMLVLLALGTVPQVTAVATGALFRSAGATDLLFRTGMLQTALSVIAILAGLPWGAVGVAAALLVRSWLGLPLLLLPLRRIVGLPLGELLGPTTALGWPVAGLAAAELIAGALVHGRSPWLVLAAQLAAGAAVYGAVVWRTDRGTVRKVQRRLRPLLAR